MIRTEELTKRYGSVLAVDGIGLDVRPGDIYGFLGANGSGKTTTVRTCCNRPRPPERPDASRSSANVLMHAGPGPGAAPDRRARRGSGGVWPPVRRFFLISASVLALIPLLAAANPPTVSGAVTDPLGRPVSKRPLWTLLDSGRQHPESCVD